MSQTLALPRSVELPGGGSLPRVGSVDAVALEARAAELAKRSIKRESKVFALELAIRMMDLTTLEGADTPGKVRAMCAKAMYPDPGEPSVPHVAAVCVYPSLVAVARRALRGSAVKVASVATAFPSGQAPLDVKLADVRAAVEAGADEIDMVIDRGRVPLRPDRARLRGGRRRQGGVRRRAPEGDPRDGRARLATTRCGRRRSSRSRAAPTSSRRRPARSPPAATLPVTLCMLEVIRDVHDETGLVIGMKPAGGIRTAKQAIQYLCVLHETLGPDWMTPDLFRFGASSLLNDVLLQLRKQRTGIYRSPDEFTLD